MDNKKPNHLLLTAINDNNPIWYDLVIPFLLSLKQTNFDGDVGFIAYELSNDKIALLKSQGYKVFYPKVRYKELLLDRQYAVSEIAQQFHYEKIALYDADIWFPHTNFTVFEQVIDPDKLYCTNDIWRCDFLTQCINEEDRPLVEQKFDQVVEKFNYVWQAGMIIGSANAWKHYGAYLSSLLTNNQFIMMYGLDMAILNMYSADTDNILPLHKKYNCVPLWGVRIDDEGNDKKAYLVEGEKIEGFHITGIHRKTRLFSFSQMFADRYYNEGKLLRPQNISLATLPTEQITQLCLGHFDQNATTLKLVSVSLYGTISAYLNHSNLANRPEKDLMIEVSGDSCLVLSNPHSQAIKLSFHLQAVLNSEICENCYLDNIPVKINHVFYYELQPHQHIELRTKEVNIEKRITWVLHNTQLI